MENIHKNNNPVKNTRRLEILLCNNRQYNRMRSEFL